MLITSGTNQGMLVQIDQLHLEWTEDEDDEDTCNVCRNINFVTNDI